MNLLNLPLDDMKHHAKDNCKGFRWHLAGLVTTETTEHSETECSCVAFDGGTDWCLKRV